MTSLKRKQMLIAAGILLSLILAVGVYRFNHREPIHSGQENIESADASTPDQLRTFDSRLTPKDAPRINSESAAPVDSAKSKENAAMVRSDIHRSPTLPVGVAFNNTLGLLDDLNKEDPANALYYLQYELGFDETDDAKLSQDLLSRLLDVLQTIDSEIKRENGRIGCSFGVPIATGDQIYAILEAMNDTPEIVAKKHLDLLYEELEEDTAKRVQQWLNNQKTKITQVKYNYKEYYEATGRNADARLAEICNEATEGMQ